MLAAVSLALTIAPALTGVAFASSGATARGGSAQAPALLEIAGFGFPARLAGLVRGEVSNYEPGAPGLGSSIKYGGRSQSADIYVYDKRLDLSRADPEIAGRELESVIDDVREMGRRGHYNRVKLIEIGAVTPTAAPITFAAAKLQFSRENVSFDSYGFVAIVRGKFIKVRYSTTTAPENDAKAQAFLAEVAGLLV